MTKQAIEDLIIEGDIAGALKALRTVLPKEGNIIINLLGQWNMLQKSINEGTISEDNANLRTAKIRKSTLEIAEKLPAAVPAGPAPVGPAATVGKRTVFLSYNHKDKAVATQVKDFLRGKGISVTIDSEAMAAGEEIAAFINRCIRDSDVTLSLVSTNSLLSAWVGMETMNTLVGEKIAGKKFISVVIDGAFYDRKFVDTAFETVEQRIIEIKGLIMGRLDKGRGIEDLTSELTRNKNLNNDLPEIVANLRARLNVDISGDNFNGGMDKVARDILA